MKTAHDLVVAAKQSVQEISVDQAVEAIQSCDLLIDVRESEEYMAGFLPGAVHMSRGMLEFKGALDRATALMAPERAEVFKSQFATATADMAKRRITADAKTISAGLEALTPAAATVAVLMRGTQTEPGQQPSSAVLALRVALSKQDDRWLVVDVIPISAR